MKPDPIIEELHRHREELFQEFGNDPDALVKHLQERERISGRLVQAPPSSEAKVKQRIRFARR
jgi:hypothetical protein